MIVRILYWLGFNGYYSKRWRRIHYGGKGKMKVGPIMGFIFIFLIYISLFCATVLFLIETIEKVLMKIRSMRHKRTIKKLKEMPTWDQTCINLLKGLKEDEKNDRN